MISCNFVVDCHDEQTFAVNTLSVSVHCCCADSYESILHRTNIGQFALNLQKSSEELRQALKGPKIERFIGVIYLPKTERYRWATSSEAAGIIMCYVSVGAGAFYHFTSACKAGGPVLVRAKLYFEIQVRNTAYFGCVWDVRAAVDGYYDLNLYTDNTDRPFS